MQSRSWWQSTMSLVYQNRCGSVGNYNVFKISCNQTDGPTSQLSSPMQHDSTPPTKKTSTHHCFHFPFLLHTSPRTPWWAPQITKVGPLSSKTTLDQIHYQHWGPSMVHHLSILYTPPCYVVHVCTCSDVYCMYYIYTIMYVSPSKIRSRWHHSFSLWSLSLAKSVNELTSYKYTPIQPKHVLAIYNIYIRHLSYFIHVVSF